MNEIATTEAKVTHRLLNRDEWGKIEFIFQENGVEPPNKDISFIVVEELDGEITQILTLQLVGHSEPWWCREDRRGKSSVVPLVNLLNQVAERIGLSEYFAFAPNENIAKACSIVGMEELPWKVFRKRVEKEG